MSMMMAALVFVISAVIGGFLGKGNILLALLFGIIGVSIYIGFIDVSIDWGMIASRVVFW